MLSSNTKEMRIEIETKLGIYSASYTITQEHRKGGHWVLHIGKLKVAKGSIEYCQRVLEDYKKGHKKFPKKILRIFEKKLSFSK